MDPQIEVGHFFEKISVWREESHREFSNILTLHSSSINMSITNLLEEVGDLKDKLSAMTRERNNLLETGHNLSKSQRNNELPGSEPLSETKEIHIKDSQEELSQRHAVGAKKKQNVEIPLISSETVDISFNEDQIWILLKM